MHHGGSTGEPMSRTRRSLLITGVAAAGAALAGCLDGSASPDEEASFTQATSYMEPSCECCVVHAEYLDETDAEINAVELSNEELDELNRELGIPSDYRSCHVTEVENYAIAGHVPVGVINEILEAEPSADVITLPDMPSGSPGMPGSKEEEWVFYAIDDDGNIEEFTRK